MAKHLKPDDVRNVINLLHKWKYELTWDLLVEECEKRLGLKTTRQALSRKAQIKEQFNQTKQNLKVSGESRYARPNSIDVAHRRIEALAAEVESLRSANNRFIEKFVRWQYNAMTRGLTEEQLNQPLPRSDARGNSVK